MDPNAVYPLISGTLCASGAGLSRTAGMANETSFIVVEMRGGKYIARRFTPREAERLQGFPGGWTLYGTTEKPNSDSARYRCIGNSIAIPCAEFILRRMAERNEKCD